jgi:signal peptidase II
MKGWLFFLVLLVLDAASKWLALHYIPPFHYGVYPFGGIGLFSLGGVTFSLNYIVNTGIAWGLLAGKAGLLFALRAGIILGIFLFVPKRFPIWLILTGAVGNAIDYWLYGHVIDFFHFTFWGYSFPIFNIADACISLGALWLFFGPQKAKQPQTL